MPDSGKKCRRCYQPTNITIMSRFNTDEICPSCEEREQAHPQYVEAKAAELAAVKAGDYNFPGIGAPSDLYFRRVRLALDDPAMPQIRAGGYPLEESGEEFVIATFPPDVQVLRYPL